jgi:hypothetical protein
MKNPIETVPELFARWRKAAWPLLIGRSESLPEAQVRKAEQSAADHEWEDEGGAVKKPPTAAPTPKLPL